MLKFVHQRLTGKKIHTFNDILHNNNNGNQVLKSPGETLEKRGRYSRTDVFCKTEPEKGFAAGKLY